MIEIKFKKLDENAVIPSRKHFTDAGYDLIATSYNYNPKYDRFEYGLGFSTNIPLGYEAEIRPRSSQTKTDFYIPNSPATIDSGYTGEWKIFFKFRDSSYSDPPYKVGDAIAQVLFHETTDAHFVEVEELNSTDRGEDGGLIRNDYNFKV